MKSSVSGRLPVPFFGAGKLLAFRCPVGRPVIRFAFGYGFTRLDGRRLMPYLHEAGVMEPFRRRVASCLLEALKEECRRRGIGRFFPSTSQDNTAANSLYRKLGG